MDMLKIDEGTMLLSLYPDSELSSVVECIWQYEGTSVVYGRENVLPDGRFQLILNLAAGKGAVCGLRSQYVVIDTAQITWMMSCSGQEVPWAS
jgi:hypothetical protein